MTTTPTPVRITSATCPKTYLHVMDRQAAVGLIATDESGHTVYLYFEGKQLDQLEAEIHRIREAHGI